MRTGPSRTGRDRGLTSPACSSTSGRCSDLSAPSAAGNATTTSTV